MENLNTQFAKELSRIKDPAVFVGVARVLKVGLVTEEKDESGHLIAREGEDIITDVLVAFDGAGRKRKRELLKILRKANKSSFSAPTSMEVDLDATGTEDSEDTKPDNSNEEMSGMRDDNLN